MKFKKIEKIKVDATPVYNLTVDHPNHNFLISINNQTSIIVKNCDEMNEKSVDEALALLNTLDNRFASRFSGSDLVFQSVVSSARTTNSPVGEYVKKLPKNDPAIISFSPCLWEVKPDPNFVGDGTTFPVLVGNGSIPSRIITNPGELKALDEGDFYIPAGCLLINVPTVYRSKFELQLDQSIQDIAGISTYDNSMLFRDTSQLEDHLLVPELTIEANLKENNNIFDNLPLDKIFVKSGLKDEWRLKRYPNASRYMHLDLSSSGECDTGICMLHKEYKINEITKEKETIFVTDFIIYITAKNTTDLEAVQNFAMELVTRGHIPIHTISCDQFQSQLALNNWESSGYFNKVEKVSVDTKLDPYLNAAALIEAGKVKVGQCEKLKKELEALVIDKGKVTRTTQLKDGCLLGNTKIPLLSGKTLSIEELLNNYENEYVLGYDIENNKLTPVKIQGVIDKGFHDNLYKITLNNGKELICTNDHLILKKDKTYCRADELKVGDSLLPVTIFNKHATTSSKYEDLVEAGIPLTNHCVIKIEKLNITEKVYDIQLDTVHNFMIDSGIFVHNCDALVGAIFNAQMNYHDIPQNEYQDKIIENKKIDYNTYINTEQEGLFDL